MTCKVPGDNTGRHRSRPDSPQTKVRSEHLFTFETIYLYSMMCHSQFVNFRNRRVYILFVDRKLPARRALFSAENVKKLSVLTCPYQFPTQLVLHPLLIMHFVIQSRVSSTVERFLLSKLVDYIQYSTQSIKTSNIFTKTKLLGKTTLYNKK